jgi:uncharacterized protein YjbJ (UPF0337 family)
VNRDQAKGKWDQMKGRAKKAWGEISDNDSRRAEGSADKLHGVIQERVGDTKKLMKTTLRKIHLK